MVFSQVRILAAFVFSAALGYLVAFAIGLPIELCLISSAMLTLAAHCVHTDVKSYRLDDRTLLAIGILGLVAHILQYGAYSWSFIEAISQCLLYGLQFEFVRRIYRRIRGRSGLGFGDVKLATVAGGWLSPPYFGGGVILAAIATGIAIFCRESARKNKVSITTYLPFGSALAPSIWVLWIVKHASSLP